MTTGRRSVTVDWDEKRITVPMCSTEFKGVKVTPPIPPGDRPVEIDWERKRIKVYVKRVGPARPPFGVIEVRVARTWRDIFCSVSGSAIPDIESIVGYANYWRDMGYGCGTSGDFGPAPHLVWNRLLANTGTSHSKDMALNGFMGHTGTDGSNVGNRAVVQGYGWEYIGENVARGQRTISDVMEAWMASPIHCANIMNPLFTEIGVGVVEDANGQKYWTMVLAKPAPTEVFDTQVQPCCVENSIWWKRHSRNADGIYILDDTPTLHVTLPAYCQWVMTIVRTYLAGPEETNYLTVRSLAGFGGGGFVIGHSITQNKIVPGMGIKQLDYFEVGKPQLAEIESCSTVYCTCCMTGGEILYVLVGKPICRVMLANGELVLARYSDHVAWEVGDWVFMVKNSECDAVEASTDSCRNACEIDTFYVHQAVEEQCPYVILPLRIGDHGA